MEASTVSGKGQVTIPKELRERLGIRQGSKVEFLVAGDHLEIRVLPGPEQTAPPSGFGMLKCSRRAVPADLDPAPLVPR